MKTNRDLCITVRIACCIVGIFCLPGEAGAAGNQTHVDVTVDWKKVTGESKTAITIQVCPEPPMRRGTATHRNVFESLRDLKVSYARLQPWYPYPRLSMAALEPPQAGKTSWDFSLIDPIVLDFYAAAEGRPIMLNMAIPAWLFKGPRHQYPDDPDEIDWAYESRPDVGTEFGDPSFGEAVGYFTRVAQWYIKGGFTDEYGKRLESGHRLKIDYWEVLNEQEETRMEGHKLDPQVYTAFYDALVSKLKALDPEMKFSGLALGNGENLHYFEYFLNKKNHQPGIPLDMVSYHKYFVATTGRTLAERQERMLASADAFFRTVHRIELIRRRLSPGTRTFVSELGLFWGEEFDDVGLRMAGKKIPVRDPKIPDEFWPLGGSLWAYGFLGLVREGVDLVAAAELVDYPSQLAGTNLLDWNTGKPNAVYRVVKLLHDELPPGAKLLQTTIEGSGLAAQGFDTPQGRKILLINKTMQPMSVRIEDASTAFVRTVDKTTGSAAPRVDKLTKDGLDLQPMATAIVSWRNL